MWVSCLQRVYGNTQETNANTLLKKHDWFAPLGEVARASFRLLVFCFTLLLAPVILVPEDLCSVPRFLSHSFHKFDVCFSRWFYVALDF